MAKPSCSSADERRRDGEGGPGAEPGSAPATGPDPDPDPGPGPDPAPGIGRRRILTFLVAAPTLALAARVGADELGPATEAVAAPAADGAELLSLPDLGDVLIVAGLPTAHMLVLQVAEDGTVRFRLPRAEVGQGLTTAVAMLIAEELDTPLANVRVELEGARPELLFNQFTGSSNAVRSLYDPVRAVAAAARTRLIAAAVREWKVGAEGVSTRDGAVIGPDGRSASYGSLAAAAAAPGTRGLKAAGEAGVRSPQHAKPDAKDVQDATRRADALAKPEAEHRLVGRPTGRIDARAMVTGQQQYTLDLDVPGAKPAMIRRPPTVNGTVRKVKNEAAVRALPGVLDLAVVPSGVAVVAETFGQALAGKNALQVEWGKGTIDDLSDDGIRKRLRAATGSFLPALLRPHLDAEFDFAPVSHAPLETNSAVADVRADRATIWTAAQSPIIARDEVAKAIGLPAHKVDFHVVQAGGSFGRRLFFDAAVEAALVSKAVGRPVRLMWSRIDDMRHGRMRPPSHHKLRAVFAAGAVFSYEHRMACVETDFGHGIGDAISAGITQLPGGNMAFGQVMFGLTVRSPYSFGLAHQSLHEVPLRMHTGSWRSVYSAAARGAEEMFADELAARLRMDPVHFRRVFLKDEGQRAVLDHVAKAGQWGREMPKGYAQGVGFHAEYKSCTACLVEIDARDPKAPRVTKAVIAVDVGRAINPRGIEAQMLGGLTDAISTTLSAGLHFDKGLPLEGSYSQFHYARQKNAPREVRIDVLPSSGRPGGVGELGVPAAVGAIGNAYARATGTRPRSFPVNFEVDFEPFPR